MFIVEKLFKELAEKPLQRFFLSCLNGSLDILKKACQTAASMNISFISFFALFGPSPGFSSVTRKPLNQSSPNFVTLIIRIYLLIHDSGGSAETDDLRHQPNENEARKNLLSSEENPSSNTASSLTVLHIFRTSAKRYQG